jgi:hypothetical protein
MAKKFSNEVYLIASSIPFKSSVEEVYECLNKLETHDDQHVKGIFYYYYYFYYF